MDQQSLMAMALANQQNSANNQYNSPDSGVKPPTPVPSAASPMAGGLFGMPMGGLMQMAQREGIPMGGAASMFGGAGSAGGMPMGGMIPGSY